MLSSRRAGPKSLAVFQGNRNAAKAKTVAQALPTGHSASAARVLPVAAIELEYESGFLGLVKPTTCQTKRYET